MPKERREKFYAVLNGRGGTRIYSSFVEFRSATYNFSGASAKSFLSHQGAARWLEKCGFPLEQGVEMKPKTVKRSKIHRQYSDSTICWQDHRPKQLVSVQVQTDQPSTDPTDMYSMSDLRTSVPAQQPQLPGPSFSASAPPSDETPAVELSKEQKHVLDIVKAGRNLFFTGPAGTGKSVLLREIIRQLKTSSTPEEIAVTATTGIAGVNIGGSTVHSWAGIGLGKETGQKLADKIKKSTLIAKRWKGVKVLIVDEISMMDGQLFDKLEYIACVVRECDRPFGGIQLILSGDFFQLPPVPEQSHQYRMPSTLAFDAKSWSRCISQRIALSQVFRQTDNTFVDILSSMRLGTLSAEHIDVLKRLSRPLHYNDNIVPSEVFPLRAEVEACNNTRLRDLPGAEFIYNSIDRAGYDFRHLPIPTEEAHRLLDRLVAIQKITLKLGARVMLIQNIIQKVLVNGSAGIVTDFLTVAEAVKRNISIAERPKAGPEEDHATPDVELRPLDNNTFGREEKWPLVCFTNGHELLCAPLEFTVVGFMGNTEASRLQVPLILAWAMSVHKSQGQTLTRVKIDLGRTFEKGQAYVAISRATTMEDLQITNFQPGMIMAHPRVVEWHGQWLSEIEESSGFSQEMDSEEAIAHWNDTEDWHDTDGWGDSEDVLPPRLI